MGDVLVAWVLVSTLLVEQVVESAVVDGLVAWVLTLSLLLGAV